MSDESHELRQGEISIEWLFEGSYGRVSVNGEYWAGVEWSKARQRWCIEDSQGECLAHVRHIHGGDTDKDTAVALAVTMVRDGRMPSPQQALEAREAWNAGAAARRAKRNHQPAQIRKRDERAAQETELRRARSAAWSAELDEKNQQPLFVALSETFDFSDPDLWKSNSWAAMRPRLVVHARAHVARLEADLAHHTQKVTAEPFAMHVTKDQRRSARERSQGYAKRMCADIQVRLDRARAVLRTLEGQS